MSHPGTKTQRNADIARDRKAGMTMRAIAFIYGISTGRVSDILEKVARIERAQWPAEAREQYELESRIAQTKKWSKRPLKPLALPNREPDTPHAKHMRAWHAQRALEDLVCHPSFAAFFAPDTTPIKESK